MTDPLQLRFRVACAPAHRWGEVLVWEPPHRLAYRGWERLGSRGEAWRDRNRRGWETLLPWYVEFVEGGASDG